MPCLALTRFNGPQQSRQCFYHPMMTLGLGGEKESLIGGRPVVYGAGEAVVVALDLPGTYQIRNASPEQPFLSLSIRLDRAIITGAPHRRRPNSGPPRTAATHRRA